MLDVYAKFPAPLGPCSRGCGREATQRHHRDRNAKNNEETNIELLCDDCHMEEHGRERRKSKHERGGRPLRQRKRAKVQLIVHFVPAEIQDAVLAEARLQRTSLTNVVGRAVSDCLHVEWPESRYGLRGGAKASPPWVMRIPWELDRALKREARRSRMPQVDVVLSCLAERFGVSFVR